MSRAPLIAFGGLWLAQAALAAGLPLVADEAYYLAWSRDLGPGYLDHPPGIAWWIALSGGHPRLTGLLVMPLAWGLLADAARRWGAARWRWIPALAMATPLGFSAGLLATPDAPLVFCWCLALWALSARRLLLVGLALGLGLWSKSALLVALPGLFWVMGPKASLMASVVALAVYAPHVHWSLAHDGLPWSFQSSHRVIDWHPLRPLEVIGGQALLVTPGIAWLAYMAWRHGRDDSDAIDRALRALGLPVLAFWVLASVATRVEANWPALAWPATLILVVRRDHPRLPRVAAMAPALTLAAAAALPILDRGWPHRGPPRDGPALRACLASSPPPVAARYQEKALLDLAGPPVPYLRAAGRRPSEYDRRVTPPVPACDFVYLAPPAALDRRCSGAVEPVEVCGRAAARCRCVPGR